MKYIYTYLVLLLNFSCFTIEAQTTNYGEEFADAIIQRWPNSINDMTNKGWEYSNSIVLHGIEKIYEKTENPAYLKYIKSYVDSYVNSKGAINFNPLSNNLDHLHPGLLCLFLYEKTGEQKYKLAADNIRAEFDNQPRNDSGGFWHKQAYENQMWVDGIYMAEPFLVKYGYMFGDAAYANNEATSQTLLLARHAFVPETKLLKHAWDGSGIAGWCDINGVSPEIWSRGMGWYAMAMVDILKYLPDSHLKYNEMISLLQDIAEGLKNTQDASTGLWYQVVNKGKNKDNWIEISGSGMFIYMLKTALDNKWIDTSYNSVVNKAWEGFKNKITTYSDGMPAIKDYVGAMGVQINYAAYVGMSQVNCPPSTHPHGYCAALMACSVMETPVKKTRYKMSSSVIGNGTISTSPASILIDSGKVVTITANPDPGNEFLYWTDDASGTNNPVYIIMTSDKSVKAVFDSLNIQTYIYQAEDASWQSGTAATSTFYDGYTGTGYVNTNNSIDVWIEFNVTVPRAGNYELSMYYSSASTSLRPASVSVNGTEQISTLNYPNTGSWSAWKPVTFDLNLNAISNTLRFTSLSSYGAPLIDKLELYVLIPETTNIYKENADNDFSCYPTVVTNYATIKYNLTNNQRATISVTDVSGRKVIEYQPEYCSGNNEQIIDMRNLKSGIYICMLKNGENIFIQKIIKRQ